MPTFHDTPQIETISACYPVALNLLRPPQSLSNDTNPGLLLVHEAQLGCPASTLFFSSRLHYYIMCCNTSSSRWYIEAPHYWLLQTEHCGGYQPLWIWNLKHAKPGISVLVLSDNLKSNWAFCEVVTSYTLIGQIFRLDSIRIYPS